MITSAGKTYIKRYLSGQAPTLARTIVLGIGNAAAVDSDKRMNFEILRMPITLSTYDPVADKLIFKASIPDEYIGKVYEIGLYSIESDTLNDAPTQVISTFDQAEGWSAGTWSTTNTRVGVDSLRLSTTGAASSSSELELAQDFSMYSPNDALLIAVNSSAAANVSVKFETDSANYFSASSAAASGYNINTILKSAFTATGNPSWSNITKMTVTGTGTTGTVNYDFDAIAFVDQDFNNPDQVLVARQVLTTPFSKIDNSVNEVEFRMSVAVS